jgi:hypothetical protein
MSSVTYSLGDFFSSEELIRESFERIGVFGDKYSVVEFQAGVRCAKLQLAQWAASQDLLYLIHREMIQMDQGQTFLQLPDYIARVLQVVRTNYVSLQTGGAAIETPGQADCTSIFNLTSVVPYVQTVPNGYVGRFYLLPQQIWYVGVIASGLSGIAQIYSLVIEYSTDNINWIVAKNVPKEKYYPNQVKWIVCEQPQQAPYWRVRETAGGTLGITNLIFGQPDPSKPDVQIGTMDRNSFLNLSSKMNPDSTTSAYYFNEKEVKSLYIYGNTSQGTETFVYAAQTYAKDIGNMSELPQLALKYYDPLAAAVAYRLSLKYGLPSDRVQLLKADALETFQTIRDADKENVDIRISYNMGSIWDVRL